MNQIVSLAEQFNALKDSRAPISLHDFQQMFQIGSPLYAYDAPGSKEMKQNHGFCAATLQLANVAVETDIADVFALPTVSGRMQTSDLGSVSYGEYTKYSENILQTKKYLYLIMLESTPDPESDTGEFLHMPHFVMHARIRSVNGEDRIEPLGVLAALGEDEAGEMQWGGLQDNAEFYRGLCYADTLLCQIMASAQPTPADTSHWLQQGDLYVSQKLEWMRMRSYDDVRALGTGKSAGRPSDPAR